MNSKEWFNDESIVSQEAVNISDGDTEVVGISIIIKDTEVLLELPQLKSAVDYLERDFNHG